LTFGSVVVVKFAVGSFVKCIAQWVSPSMWECVNLLCTILNFIITASARFLTRLGGGCVSLVVGCVRPFWSGPKFFIVIRPVPGLRVISRIILTIHRSSAEVRRGRAMINARF
jgi:hypothetical protein